MTSKILPAFGMAAITAAAFSLSSTPAAAQDGKVDFEKQILPLFEKHCFECHKAPYYDDTGRLKKPKSGLRMDNPELLLEGGDGTDEKGDDGGIALKPGDKDKSTIYLMMKLHEDEDMAMPPKGDRVPEADIELIGKWITEGASFGEWKGTPKDAEPTPPAN